MFHGPYWTLLSKGGVTVLRNIWSVSWAIMHSTSKGGVTVSGNDWGVSVYNSDLYCSRVVLLS